VEDVSVPKFSDWYVGKEVRPLQQLFFYFCMNCISFLSSATIIPTQHFSKYLPNKKNVKVITGCLDVPNKPLSFLEDVPHICKDEIFVRILFSGKLEFEHGIDIFLDSIHEVQLKCGCTQISYVIDICGQGPKSAWVNQYIFENGISKIIFHGFVSNSEYLDLLKQSDICVALQQPLGRYGFLKTPSKVYEYLAYGKAVISTDVGDLSELPQGVITLIDTQNQKFSLTQSLYSLLSDPDMISKQKQLAYNYARENFAYKQVAKSIESLMLCT
jgi:glycosyltransferase involved in cell wall biosynthesis